MPIGKQVFPDRQKRPAAKHPEKPFLYTQGGLFRIEQIVYLRR